MLYREIIKILSSYFFLYAMILGVHFGLAAYYQFFVDPRLHPQPHSTGAFFLTLTICLGLAGLCHQFSKEAKAPLYRRESLVTVALIWFITPAIAALPFLFSRTLERFDQAYFEMTAGFTTTGASILEAKHYDPQTGEETPIHKTYCGIQDATYVYYGNISPVVDPVTGDTLEGLEAVGRALLIWRSMTQWLGGIGIIVLFVALLPALGMGGKMLFQTETPGPIKEGVVPRIKETAALTGKIYLGLTLLAIFALMMTNANISLFDAFTTALSTVSTGGFSVHNDNIAFYQSASTEWVILIFSFLGSVNFSLYYHMMRGKFFRLFDTELLIYVVLICLFSLFVGYQLVGWPISLEQTGVYSWTEAIRSGFFQVVSAQSSAGFFIDDYDKWPYITHVILLFAMYIGGMAGSTAGGLKVIRMHMLFQIAKNKIESVFRPQLVRVLYIGKKEISLNMAFSVLCYFLMVIVFSALVTFLYVLDNIDPETAMGVTAAMINNTGIGFRAAGPTNTFVFLNSFSLWLSSFIMILARLEFYAILVILLPAFWRDR
jgi:trk system potassium uptake protein